MNSIRIVKPYKLPAEDHALQIIRDSGGVIRTQEALRKGIHPRVIYELRDSGRLGRLSRGLYHIPEEKQLSRPDLVVVALKIPRAVISLASALAFHGITAFIPESVSVALPRNHETPRLDNPAITVHRFSDPSYREGVEEHLVDGINVNIYNPEKSIADCFKFRSAIGKDLLVEAIILYKKQMRPDREKLRYYAHICRVEKAITPYLDILL
jgi:predicted transcriptional regulator of viral defense system